MKLSDSIKEGEPVTQRTIRLFRLDSDHLDEWRKEAKTAFDFVASKQWSEDDAKELEDSKRPVVTFNRTKTVIDAVTGNERSNRREVRYIPREMGDVEANEVYSAAAEWFRDQSHADNHESDSFSDECITGYGWTETRIDFDLEEDGKPVIERISPFEMVYDHKARQSNLADAKRVWRHRQVALEEAKIFSDTSLANDDDYDAKWADAKLINEDRDKFTEDTSDTDKMVTLVHVQWLERKTIVSIADPMTGEKTELSTAEYAKLNERLQSFGMPPLKGRKRSKMVRMQAILGNVVLKVSEAPFQSGFSWQCMTAYRDENEGTFYGLVRTMIDPQTWANKWLSQTLHIMNVNAKGGLMAERTAFENTREAEANWADPSKITWMNDGALQDGRVKEKQPAQMPAGFKDLTEFAVSSIRDVTGVSLEVLGLREATQAASLEYQRKQSGMTILQPLFDGLKYYRELQGRIMLEAIQEDMSDGRLIRIKGKDGAEQYVPLTRQASATYDIIIDDAPASPNHKEMVWQMFMQLLPTFGASMSPEVTMKMLEYSPFPSGLVKELQELVSQPDPGAEQQAQFAAQMAQSELAKVDSETKENVSDAQEVMASAQLKEAQTVKTLAEADQMQLAQSFGPAIQNLT